MGVSQYDALRAKPAHANLWQDSGLKRSIAYTSNWLHTLVLAGLLALFLVFVLIFLQPFDTYQAAMPFKNLKLFGYSACIILPIMLLHGLEEFWFKKNHSRWFLYQELIILSIGFVLISTASFFYNSLVVNNMELQYNYMVGWAVDFGLPFVPIFIPLWAYLRYRFSTVTIAPKTEKPAATISIEVGKQQVLQFQEQKFLLAQAQANYVDVYWWDDNEVKKEMIRFTISGLIECIPSALQIHRSFLVNPAHIHSISGNTRKGTVRVAHIDEDIPISPKHFSAVKNLLQSRP